MINNDQLVFEKNRNKVYKLQPFYYENLGLTLKNANIRFQNKTRMVWSYQAIEFKNLINDTLENGNLPETKKTTLQQLNSKISENDNPILITGKCKDLALAEL